MKGYRLNARTGAYVEVHEHAAWITSLANADLIGLPKCTFAQMGRYHWTNPVHRAPILLLAMSACLVRVRGHGATITFEYTIADAKALRVVQAFLEKTRLAGPETGLQLNNLRTGKTRLLRCGDLRRCRASARTAGNLHKTRSSSHA